jgi:protein-S-isoprenylcysteine O-methyltransferase Ste14
VAFSIVVGYEIISATRTFSIVTGERPSLGLQVLPLSYAIVTYKIFRTAIQPWLVVPGLIVLASSLALFEWARRSIRGKFFSYAMSDDTPGFLWTAGPFAYIRNPFYTSYLLSYVGAAIIFPSVTTVAVFAGMLFFYRRIALHEERKFERSGLSSEYAAYKKRTGRFIPITRWI